MNHNLLALRVQESRLLTDSEKTYWVQHLPRMNPEQITKLETILSQGESLQWTSAIPNYQAINTLIPQSA